jgi:hypothetical protein
MNRLAIELFIEFHEATPFKTIRFLIDQYETVSEFETVCVENEVSLMQNRKKYIYFIENLIFKRKNLK